MPAITGPMAQSLERNRSEFNARFAAAQAAGARVDPPAFLNQLTEIIEPIVRAVAADFTEKVDAVTAALYDLSLELFASHLLGPQSSCPPVIDAWRRLLPKLPRLIAREPARVAASVTNAIHNLARSAGARPAQWLDAMIALASELPDVHALLECGKVLAWRAGMPQYRDGALAAARRLDAPLAARALDLPPTTARPDLHKALDRLVADPWITPADALADPPPARSIRLAAQVGAFRGFGGPFLRPPTVQTIDGQLIVTDNDSAWRLHADANGHLFQRIDLPKPAPPVTSPITACEDGTITWQNVTTQFDDLANPTSIACAGPTAALTLANSHHVFLIARG